MSKCVSFDRGKAADQRIQCEICKTASHLTCAGLTSEVNTTICSHKNILWVCDGCEKMSGFS